MRFVVLFDRFYLIIFLEYCLMDTRASHHLHRSNNAILVNNTFECLAF
jgi:hypothetical protein